MAESMGLHLQTFRDKFKDLTTNLKRSMLQYAKNLFDLAEHRASDQFDPGVEPAANIKMTDEGLPILPEPTFWRGRIKKEIEPLIRTYVGQHYSEFFTALCCNSFDSFWQELASGGRTKHVPFGALKNDARPMIAIKYLLRRDVFQDPRNMQKEDIIAQLDHIYARQQQFGPEDAFKFSHYLDKDSKLQVAYPDRKHSKKHTRTPKKTPKPKQKGKGKQKRNTSDVPAGNQFEGLLSWDADAEEPATMPEDQPEPVGPQQVIDPALVNLRHDGTVRQPGELENIPPGQGFTHRNIPAEQGFTRQDIPAEEGITHRNIPAEEGFTLRNIPAEGGITRQDIPAEAGLGVQKVPAEEHFSVRLTRSSTRAHSFGTPSTSKHVRFEISNEPHSRPGNRPDDGLGQESQPHEDSAEPQTPSRKRKLDSDVEPRNSKRSKTGKDDSRSGRKNLAGRDDSIPQTRSRSKQDSKQSGKDINRSSDVQANVAVRRQPQPTRKSSRIR